MKRKLIFLVLFFIYFTISSGTLYAHCKIYHPHHCAIKLGQKYMGEQKSVQKWFGMTL